MTLKIFIRFQKPIALVLLPFLIMMLFECQSIAQDKLSDDHYSTNVRWTIKSDLIFITYDLIGSSDLKYIVSAVMKKDNDATFNAVPLTVEGDIGEGTLAGKDRQIRWYYRRDFPIGFQGQGYYFEISVKPVEQTQTWLYYTIGAAAVTGGLIALLAGKNQNSTRPIPELPLPPGRP